jgi:hypothetical protein
MEAYSRAGQPKKPQSGKLAYYKHLEITAIKSFIAF